MTQLFKKTFSAIMLTGLLSVPAFAGTAISVDLWDAGSDMTMVDNMRMMNHQNMMGMENAPMGIKLSAKTVPAGEITFDTLNSSKNLEHEMVVALLVDGMTALPYKENRGRVDENAPNMNLGEVSELEPGEKSSLTINLKPGRYMLYCNVDGHYASGMWTLLTVK